MKKRVFPLALVLALAMLLPVTAGAVQLPEDAAYFGSSAYKIYAASTTWSEAKQRCEELGGHLATITSQEEQSFLEQLNSSSRRLWIGGGRDDSNNWFWVTGEPWSYTHWAAGEPNNSANVVSNENRIAMWPKEWNDLNENNKSEQSGFICEWDLDDRTSFNSTVSPWAKEEMEEAYDKGLVPDILVGQDLTQKINRGEFASIAVQLYQELSGVTVPSDGLENPFTDIIGSSSYRAILQAYYLGITNGSGVNSFAPNDRITREQLATMLCRTVKKYSFDGWTLETDDQYYLDTSGTVRFADDGDISDWAKPSVYFMTKFQVINGVDATHFAPKAVTSAQQASGYAMATREQALALSLRIFHLSDVWTQL